MTADRARLRLWLRLLATTNEIERELRRRLRDEFGTTLPRFDVLAALERSPEGVSMGELSRRLMVSNGNTTVLVQALEEAGLVRRAVVPGDRRSFTVALTETGGAAFLAMAAAHRAWLDELLGALDDDGVAELVERLGDARASVRARAGLEDTEVGA